MSVSHFHKTINSTSVHYEQSGNPFKQLIICLHGLGGCTETFVPIVEFLADCDRYNIICVDIEGSGKTSLNSLDIRPSIPRYVSDLDDLITSLQRCSSPELKSAENAEPVILIGHSLGSIVALHYASSNPNNVTGLMLLGVGRSAAHIPAARERMLSLAATVRQQGIHAAAQLAAAANFPSEGVSSEVRDAVFRTVGASDPEGYARTCEAIMDPATHIDPGYSRIKCPAVFISGSADPLSPISRATDLQKLLGGPSSLKVAGRGHQPILEAVEDVQEAIKDFLETIGDLSLVS